MSRHMDFLGFINNTRGFHVKIPHLYTVYFEQVQPFYYIPLTHSLHPPFKNNYVPNEVLSIS
jgi:hypothetical protein